MSIFSQTNNVGIGTTDPDDSAVLDISASNKGILIPRMSTTQREMIASPAQGLLVFDINTNSFWYYKTTWTEISQSVERIFENVNGVVRNSGSDLDDFVFGGDELPVTNNPITDKLMFFDESKGAFRVGRLINNSSWGQDSIGLYSFATGSNSLASAIYSISMGNNTKAQGVNSVAIGSNSTANGDYAMALGPQTVASGEASFSSGFLSLAQGDRSVAIGDQNLSSGYISLAIGSNSTSSGTVSVALGISNLASGDYSSAIGRSSTASGEDALALGHNNTATGDGSVALGTSNVCAGNNAIAMGLFSEADGRNANALGFRLKATSYNNTVFGRWNEDSGNSDTWVETDPLFQVGNGSHSGDRANAFTILKNGTVSFENFTFPDADGTADQVFQTDGNGFISWVDKPAEGAFKNVNGVIHSPSNTSADFIIGNTILPPSGGTESGTMLFFDEGTGAFRSGELLNSANWNADSLGIASFVGGHNSRATGDFATAFGKNNRATAKSSFVAGEGSHANGEYAISAGLVCYAEEKATIAMGQGCYAIADNATAIGQYNKGFGISSLSLGNSSDAFGDYSSAIGKSNNANGDYSTVFGYFSDSNGDYSQAIGSNSESNGNSSSAIGSFVVSDGDYSTALGRGVQSTSYYSIALGSFNDGTGNPTAWIESDPLFQVGNGVDFNNKSNALTIYKNGVAEFADSLHTEGNLNIGNGSGSRIYLGNTMIQSGGPTILRMQTNIRPFTDDSFSLGSSGKKWTAVWATNGTIQTSDRRLKKNIDNIIYGLDEILTLNPVQYNWNKEENSDKKHIGLIAQELLKIIPEVVSEEGEYLGVKYAELVPVLIQAIKDQQEIIKAQESAITKLQAQNEKTSNSMNAVLDRLSKLESSQKSTADE